MIRGGASGSGLVMVLMARPISLPPPRDWGRSLRGEPVTLQLVFVCGDGSRSQGRPETSTTLPPTSPLIRATLLLESGPSVFGLLGV